MASPSGSFSLDSLTSFSERSALVDLVKEQLLPPKDAVETFGRLRRDAYEQPGLDPVTRRALGDQMDWVHRELLGLMETRIHSMLEWCVRLKLFEPSEDWSPREWVKASRAMACESSLVEAVIIKAPVTSWDSWRSAFRVEENWAAKWQGWARAFDQSPAQALRWLDEFLVKPASQTEVQWKALLGAYRGRLALQIFLCGLRQWPAASLVALNQRLEGEGAPCLLRAVDFSPLIKDKDKIVTAAVAKERFRGFLRQHPAEGKAWLEASAPLAGQGIKIDPQARASRLWSFLSLLGHHQAAGARDLELAFRNVVHAKFGGPGWESVLGADLFDELGALRPQPAVPAAVTKPAPPKPAKPAKPAAVKPSTAIPASAKPASPDLPPIPRFPKRA